MSFEAIEEININVDTKIYENIEEWNQFELKNRNKTDLIILHSNIRNLSRKSFHLLQLYLENKIQNIDIIILSEINCKPEEIKFYHLQNFNVTYYCREKKKGGGIIIYTKENINITESKHMNFKYTENIEIQMDSKNIILNVIYRPPKMNINEYLKELKKWLKIKEVKQKDIILIGDVNINTLEDNNITQSYLELLAENKIINTIRKPTRVETRKGRITRTCIDHVNLRTKNKFTSGIIEEKIADHYFIYTKISESKINDANELVEMEIFNQEKLNEMIMEYNWDTLINENQDCEELYNKFVHIYNELLKKAVKTIKIKKKYVGNSWITEELRRLIKLKNEKWKNVKRNPNNVGILNEYKEIRNQITNKITQAKKKEYREKFYAAKGDMKKTWKEINIIRNKKRSDIETTILKNFKISHSEIYTTSNKFNEKFKSDIEDLKKNKEEMKTKIQYNTNNYTNPNETFKINKINENELHKIIQEININKGPGYDNIRPKDIKINFLYLKRIIIQIINGIIEDKKIPQNMKISTVVPIYKKGKKNDFGNYRAIGILSCIEKILEKHMNNQLTKYVEKNKILNDSQHGFRQKKSTITLLNKYTEDINKSLDLNKYCLTLSIDLKRAYDTIDHNKMIDVLINMGMENNTKELFIDFFKNRKQRVKIGKTQYSNEIDINCGLVQGGIISPMLFNLYVNDINNIGLETNILQYADDTILYMISNDLNEAYRKIQKDFNMIIIWLNQKDIFINKEKTISILFQNPMITRFRPLNTNKIKIHENKCIDMNQIQNCNCKSITCENSIKYLGIYFESNLNWKSQTEFLTKKLNSILYQMKYIENIIPLNTKVLIYKTLCESIIRYGIESYGMTSEENLKPLKSIHKRILKSTLYPLTSRDKRKELMIKYKILNLSNLYKYILTTKYYYQDEYRQTETTNYNTRNTHYKLPVTKNKYGERTFNYTIPKILNKLPNYLKEIQNEKQMKNKIEDYYLNHNNEI